jgi:molybdenum cofactor cytidylyltransferase
VSKEPVSIQHCSIVILAAGSSSRLGQPKQLLQYKETVLLQRAIDTALQSGVENILVILGAEKDKILKELNTVGITIVFNDQWQEGMASSIRKGIASSLSLFPETDGILFMVCDQPFADAPLLQSILHMQKNNGNPIVACRYGEVTGTPALFHKSVFAELMTLKGDTGARKILLNHRENLGVVNFEEGSADIDTIADYENLLKSK